MTGLGLVCSLPKLLLLGLELLVLRGQADVVLQDTSQQAAVVMLWWSRPAPPTAFARLGIPVPRFRDARQSASLGTISRAAFWPH